MHGGIDTDTVHLNNTADPALSILALVVVTGAPAIGGLFFVGVSWAGEPE